MSGSIARSSGSFRIGIDARFYGPEGTGIGRTLVKLLPNLEKIDTDNDYFIFLKKSNWDLYHPQNPKFKKILADVDWYSIREQLYLPLLFRQQNLDLLHVPHLNVPLLYKGKMVVTIHDLIISDFKSVAATTRNRLVYYAKHFGYEQVLKGAVHQSQQIIVPTETVKKGLLTRFNLSETQVRVIYEAADETFAESVPGETEKTLMEKYGLEKYVLYVGNTFPHKNVSVLIKALPLLNDRNLKLVLVAPQSKFLDLLKEEATRLGVEKRVVFTGRLGDRELGGLYQGAGAYLFPSLSEGFGLPGLEAMSVGVPVICSEIEVFKEVYGEAAVYFDPHDPKDLAVRIELILNEKQIREKYIQAGYSQVKKYSWEKYAVEVLNVYQNALKQ